LTDNVHLNGFYLGYLSISYYFILNG